MKFAKGIVVDLIFNFSTIAADIVGCKIYLQYNKRWN